MARRSTSLRFFRNQLLTEDRPLAHLLRLLLEHSMLLSVLISLVDEETLAAALKAEVQRVNALTDDGLANRTIQTQGQLIDLLKDWKYKGLNT